jgi:hypothetical protein
VCVCVSQKGYAHLSLSHSFTDCLYACVARQAYCGLMRASVQSFTQVAAFGAMDAGRDTDRDNTCVRDINRASLC